MIESALLALASVAPLLSPATGVDRHREVVTVPAGYDPATPIPTLLGLHGFGSVPEDFAGDADYQAIADRLGIAIVAVSASVERGERGFYWSGDVARDREHVFTLLEHVADRVTPQPGAVLAIGFSQGGQLALELAVRDPEYFVGTIALCPGTGAGSQLAQAQLDDAGRARLAGRRFLVISGELESAGGRALADQDAQWLRDAGCQVVRHTYPGLDHSFPPDYYGNLSIWTQFLLGTGSSR